MGKKRGQTQAELTNNPKDKKPSRKKQQKAVKDKKKPKKNA